MKENKKTHSYLLNAALACGVMYYAWDLSRSGRTAIDWIVLSLVALAILWNLVQLGRRLHRSGGAKALWHEQRTLLFWIIGLLNTAFARSEDIGSWKYFVGWLFLAVALADSVALYRQERRLGLTPEAAAHAEESA